MKEKFGGKVTVLTMGPPKATEAIIECIEQGADRGIVITDRKVAAADTLTEWPGPSAPGLSGHDRNRGQHQNPGHYPDRRETGTLQDLKSGLANDLDGPYLGYAASVLYSKRSLPLLSSLSTLSRVESF